MSCTPYPATFPCDTAMPPVTVNPYLPTLPVPPVVPVGRPVPLDASEPLSLVLDDELTALHPVPETAPLVLLALGVAVAARRWRLTR